MDGSPLSCNCSRPAVPKLGAFTTHQVWSDYGDVTPRINDSNTILAINTSQILSVYFRQRYKWIQFCRHQQTPEMRRDSSVPLLRALSPKMTHFSILPASLRLPRLPGCILLSLQLLTGAGLASLQGIH